MYRTAIALSVVLFLVGCGNGGSSKPTAPTSGTTPPSGGTPSPVGSPTVVTVAEGQTVGGMDIAVPNPAGATNPNVLDLGVNELTGTATARNTGDRVSRGATKRVVVFGPGLSGDMQVSISGPADIDVSNVVGTKATDNTPGIAFTITVHGNAALGARTLILQASNSDVTTFTGGLEVVP